MEVKNKKKITRSDIDELLKSIAPPGKKQKAKIKAVEELNLTSVQGYKVSEHLDDYESF